MLTLKRAVVPLKIKSEEKKKKELLTKRARRSRSKGRRGTAATCQMFSEWWGEIESFTPTGSSGAGNRVGQAGDIVVPREFPFVIENKNEESWNLTTILAPTGARGATSRFWQYWEQMQKATDDYNRRKAHTMKYRKSMLVFTKNFEDILVAVELPTPINYSATYPINHAIVNSNNKAILVCLLEDFLDTYPARMITTWS